MAHLKIIVGFDGACPFSERGITYKDDGTFEVRPSWRSEPGISEEAPGCGSRFSIKVKNTADVPKEFSCFINWEDPERSRLIYHDWVSVHFPEDIDWRMFPTVLDGGGAHLRLSIPPGITHIGMSPHYGYGMAVDCLKNCNGIHGARYDTIGTSKENRDIPLLLIDDPANDSNKTDVMFHGRNHAYESAGSYCAEGMLDFLLSNDDLARYFRYRYRFHFLPMTNPDGVYNGMSRLTAPRGANLNRCEEQDDPAWYALKDYIDKVRPAMFLNIHNWMDKVEDGLLANTESFSKNFQKLMPDLHEDMHYWLAEWTEMFLRNNYFNTCPPEHKSWKDYVRENFNGTALTLEFPWFNRNTARMREIGKKALIAFLLAKNYKTYV